MASAKCIFNTDTLMIMNIVESNEVLEYDWSIGQDYSVVLLSGSIEINGQVLNTTSEYRIQPNEVLSALGLGETQSTFISLFKLNEEFFENNLLNEDNQLKVKSYTPDWYNVGVPSNPETTWANYFSQGNFTLTKTILNEQVLNSNWD